MKHWILILLLAAALVLAGCAAKDDAGSSPAKTTTTVPATTTAPVATTTVITTTPTQVPAPVPPAEPVLTEGYWCRETTVNIGKAPTAVTECYRFFDDGTYKWGYSPGQPMGKSPSCSADPQEKCHYSRTAQGRIAVEGGYSYTLKGHSLVDAHDPPYFTWTDTGIA